MRQELAGTDVMTVEAINTIEQRLIDGRYGDSTVTRAEALSLVIEVMRNRNHMATLEGFDEPFPPKVDEPNREINIGFNKDKA